MKIVNLDATQVTADDLNWDPLKPLGDVTLYDVTSTVESPLIPERIGDADIVITGKTPVSRETIDKCPGLLAILVVSTGYNAVDYEYAAEKGIPVLNVPGYGTRIVAQFAVGLLLEICHHVGHHDRAVKEGRWENCGDFCFWDYPVIELAGKTAGIIGLGAIGTVTAEILRALGMKVIANSPRETPEGRRVAEYVDPDRLYRESDVIFLHCPLFPETEKMINSESIGKMKDGVIIINNSRGGLIDEVALAAALNSGKVYAAGVDVVSEEPIHGDNPLLTAKNCLITPHMSWVATEARQRIVDITIDNVRSVLEGRPQNVVNGVHEIRKSLK